LSATCLTCVDYRAQTRHAEDYWTSRAGVFKRIDGLAQNFTYKLVNNAVRITAPEVGVEWLHWDDAGDARVCEECQLHSRGGRNGFYYVHWFLPQMPVHPNCRCQWALMLVNPFRTPE